MTNDGKLMMDYLVKETKKIGASMYNQGVVDGFVLIKNMINDSPDITIDTLKDVLDGFITKNTIAGEEMSKQMKVVDCKLNKEYNTIIGIEDNPIVPEADVTYHDILSGNNYTFVNGEFIETVDDTMLNNPEENAKGIILNDTTTDYSDSDNINLSFNNTNINPNETGFIIPPGFAPIPDNAEEEIQSEEITSDENESEESVQSNDEKGLFDQPELQGSTIRNFFGKVKDEMYTFTDESQVEE